MGQTVTQSGADGDGILVRSRAGRDRLERGLQQAPLGRTERLHRYATRRVAFGREAGRGRKVLVGPENGPALPKVEGSGRGPFG
jgi:hypothetical protein